MLDPAEEHAVAEQFGVARSQVRRDHLISHLLAGISQHLAEDVLFFGGTALSRTFAPDGRLSEDIDLIASRHRRSTAEALEKTLLRATRREYPGLRWNPPLTAVRDTAPASLTAPDGTTVRIQLLSPTGYAPWPTQTRTLVQRYSDAPPATLNVPTAESFAGWKTAAWAERAASRDLFDLRLLTDIGAINAEAASLFQDTGQRTESRPAICSPVHPMNRHGDENSPAKPDSISLPVKHSPTYALPGSTSLPRTGPVTRPRPRDIKRDANRGAIVGFPGG